MSYCGTHKANSQLFGDWEAEENGTTKGREGYDKTEFGQDATISVEGEAILCHHISHVPVTLTLSTPWMQAHLESILCKFHHHHHHIFARPQYKE